MQKVHDNIINQKTYNYFNVKIHCDICGGKGKTLEAYPVNGKVIAKEDMTRFEWMNHKTITKIVACQDCSDKVPEAQKYVDDHANCYHVYSPEYGTRLCKS